MSRGPDGTDCQPRTDAALFAHVAYKLERVRTADLSEWAEELEVEVGAEAIRNAPHTAARLDRAPDRRKAVGRWVLLDWRALDFFVAAVRLRLSGSKREELERLEALRGVVDLLVSRRDLKATAIVVYERRSDRERLEARLEDFGSIDSWDEVDDHRPRAMVSTFRELAREAAVREQLASTKWEGDA